MNTCINLKDVFGSKYKITFDESYSPKHKNKDLLDAWYMQLPCKSKDVCIYPYGNTKLCVEVNNKQKIAKQLLQLPNIKVHQNGGLRGNMTFTFDIKEFDLIAQIVKPKIKKPKKILTIQQKEELRTRIALARAARSQKN